MSKLIVRQCGFMDYDASVAMQEQKVAELRARPESDLGYLFLVRHAPILTLGRSAAAENILVDRERLRREGVSVRECSRGGDVTYHGPGQIVGYPVISLNAFGRDIHAYLRRLEQVIINALAGFGLAGSRRPGYTGVWIGDGKIAAIGVAIRGWVAYHGFALNVDPNLAHFGLIHPCGIRHLSVTSLRRCLGETVAEEAVETRLIREFVGLFPFDEIEQRREPPKDGN